MSNEIEVKKNCVSCVYNNMEQCACPNKCARGEQNEMGLSLMGYMIEFIKLNCPSDVGLHDHCEYSDNNCLDCWNMALLEH